MLTLVCDLCVAPLVGAWIETSNNPQLRTLNEIVAPLVGAWIETHGSLKSGLLGQVAPLVGAWIETAKGADIMITCPVAPLVGAWIETDTSSCRLAPQCHRLSCGGS